MKLLKISKASGDFGASDDTAGNESGEIVIEECSKFVDPVREAGRVWGGLHKGHCDNTGSKDDEFALILTRLI